MAFWSNAGPEPKRQFRWYMLFGGRTDLSAIRYALKKTDKPKYKIGEITHKYLNHSFYYPGRLEWEAINMTFASISEPDATGLIEMLTYAAGYITPDINAENGVATISKQKFSEALANNGVTLIQVDSNGNTIENWLLKNPFFTNVNYGTLDYGSDEIVEISCTMRYDWATNSLNGGLQAPNDSINGGSGVIGGQ